MLYKTIKYLNYHKNNFLLNNYGHIIDINLSNYNLNNLKK